MLSSYLRQEMLAYAEDIPYLLKLNPIADALVGTRT